MPSKSIKIVHVLLVALTLHIGLQGLRLLFPLTIFQRAALGRGVTQQDMVVTLLTVIFSAVLVPLLGRFVGWTRSLFIVLISMTAIRLVWQFTSAEIPDITMLFIWCTLAMIALPLLWVCIHSQEWLAGVFVGLVLDVGLMGFFYAWDYGWQRDPLAIGVALLVCGGLFLCLWLSSDLPDEPDPTQAAPANAWLVVQAFLALQILYLSNTGYVGLATNSSIAGANAIALISLLIAGSGLLRPFKKYIFGLLTVGLVGTFFIATSRGNAVSIMLWPIVQFGLLRVLWFLHAPKQNQSMPLARFALAIIGGCVVFAGAVGLQYASVIALPILRQFSQQLPTLIAAVAIIGVWYFNRAQEKHDFTLPRLSLALPAVLLIVPLGWFVTQPTFDVAPTDDPTIRVMTYNIRQGLNNQGWANLDKVVETIEREAPDVILLQEVSRGAFPNASMDIPEWLSRELEMPYVYAIAGRSQFGNATLTRYPIEEWDTDTITRSIRQARNYLRIQVDFGLDAPVQIINTHLDHRESDIRQEQIDNVLAAWAGAPYTIIGGDLNAHPEDPTISILNEAGLLSGQDVTDNGDMNTYVAMNPRRRLDYIFGTPDWTFLSSAVPFSLASDHVPVVVDFTLNE